MVDKNEDAEVVRELAGGARIVTIDHGGYDGYDYELRGNSRPVSSSTVNRLLDKGWLRSSNTAYFLTDEGMKAFLRSTDEMRDGEVE